MPIVHNFLLPKSAAALALPEDTAASFFLAFITSNLPETGQSWCPDVRAALPLIKATFTAPNSPDMAYVEVGQPPEWRDPSNIFRTVWNVHRIPTILRYSLVDGKVKETGRLVEGEILDETRFRAFLDNK